MIRIKLVMKIPSATAQQIGITVRGGKPRTYKKKKVREAEEEFYLRLLKHRPSKPFEGALRLIVQWNYHTKDKKKQGTLKVTRPDLDNINKILQDSLVRAGYLKDDSRIAILQASKVWTGEEEHVNINLEEID